MVATTMGKHSFNDNDDTRDILSKFAKGTELEKRKSEFVNFCIGRAAAAYVDFVKQRGRSHLDSLEAAAKKATTHKMN